MESLIILGQPATNVDLSADGYIVITQQDPNGQREEQTVVFDPAHVPALIRWLTQATVKAEA